MLQNAVRTSRRLLFTPCASRSLATLVVADPITSSSVSNATRSAITAATQFQDDVTLLLVGSQAQAVAPAAAKIAGVHKVLVASSASFDHAVAEQMTSLVQSLQKSSSFDQIVAPSSNASKSFVPRLGALLDVAPIADVVEVRDKETFVRPMYAGNAIATVKSSDKLKLVTVRPTAFAKAEEQGGNATIEPVDASLVTAKTKFVSEEVTKSERPELTNARIVVSGGRGLQSAEKFKILYELADKLGGAVGASRAAVDAGFVPNDLQVGQTGKVVAPELYIAVGISGAIQHVAGMKDSKTIVAINQDPDAPIFQVADYGLVGDLFEFLPELVAKV